MTSLRRIEPLGDCAILVSIDCEVDGAAARHVLAIKTAIEQWPFSGFLECVPAVTSLGVFFNPLMTETEEVICRVNGICETVTLEDLASPERFEIPVCYDLAFGTDLETVAEHCGLTVSQVVEAHVAQEYCVAMIGFSPGFPYLTTLPRELIVPRRQSPRTSVPAGAVAIAEQYTGIYPRESPGGWNLIGRTKFPLFFPERSQPATLKSGDLVRFVPIPRDRYELKNP